MGSSFARISFHSHLGLEVSFLTSPLPPFSVCCRRRRNYLYGSGLSSGCQQVGLQDSFTWMDEGVSSPYLVFCFPLFFPITSIFSTPYRGDRNTTLGRPWRRSIVGSPPSPPPPFSSAPFSSLGDHLIANPPFQASSSDLMRVFCVALHLFSSLISLGYPVVVKGSTPPW